MPAVWPRQAEPGRGRWSLRPGRDVRAFPRDGAGGDTVRHIAGPAHSDFVTSPSSPPAWRPPPQALTRTWVLRPGGRPPALSRSQQNRPRAGNAIRISPGSAGYRQAMRRLSLTYRSADLARPAIVTLRNWPSKAEASLSIGAIAVSQDREREAAHTALLCTARPQMVRARWQHVLADTGTLVRDGACSITPAAGEASAGGRSRSCGPSARRRSDERRGGGDAQFAGTAAVGAAEERGPQFPVMRRVCHRPGQPDYAVLVSGTEPADG